jgi:peptide chain release factor 1
LRYEVTGPDLTGLDNESGGHRVQRIPSTERSGRVHTSTVTVAVVVPASAVARARDEREFKVEWFSGSGAGGQHRNKHQNCCRVRHLPTGLIRQAVGRERHANLTEAMEAINVALDEAEIAEALSRQNNVRRDQVGSGMRGDKRRTYRFQDDSVYDQITGKTPAAGRFCGGTLMPYGPAPPAKLSRSGLGNVANLVTIEPKSPRWPAARFTT